MNRRMAIVASVTATATLGFGVAAFAALGGGIGLFDTADEAAAGTDLPDLSAIEGSVTTVADSTAAPAEVTVAPAATPPAGASSNTRSSGTNTVMAAATAKPTKNQPARSPQMSYTA